MPRSRRDYDSDLDDYPRRRRSQKESDSNLPLVLTLVGLGLLFLIATAIVGYIVIRARPPAGEFVPAGGIVPLDAPTVVGDEVRLVGQWESIFRDATGQVTMRKVKEINGTTEMVTMYRRDGTAFRAYRVSFQLTMRGQSKIFRYFNGWVVHGPDAGQPFPSGEYVYTLEGDTWTEFEPSGGIIVWTRRR